MISLYYGLSLPFPPLVSRASHKLSVRHWVTHFIDEETMAQHPLATQNPRFAQHTRARFPYSQSRAHQASTHWSCKVGIGAQGPAPWWASLGQNHHQTHMEEHELWGQGDLDWTLPVPPTSCMVQDHQERHLGPCFLICEMG